MLYELLADEGGIFRLFDFLTFRAGAALMTALLICFVFGGPIIRWLKSKQAEGQPIRDDGPAAHLETKKGTPTMGGTMILLAIFVSTFLWMNLSNRYVWAVMIVTLGFGALGAVDDYMKLTKKSASGMPSKVKFLGQLIISGIATYIIMTLGWETEAATQDGRAIATGLSIPFVKDLLIDLGWFFVPFAIFVMVGASNAVNLTDGLDGLAIVPVMIAASVFGLIAYMTGHTQFSSYLQITFLQGTGELTILCATIIGAALGFLWFNAPPAKVFMGDTGSLALGGGLGTIAVAIKQELVLAIVGGVFVMETASVIIQVFWFKRTGKRVFLMAPIHHHFEQKGWKEPTVVVRFWIIAAILGIIGLATLKLR